MEGKVMELSLFPDCVRNTPSLCLERGKEEEE